MAFTLWDIIDGIVKPILISLSASASKDNVGQLIMAEMKNFQQIRCSLCEGAHDADGCWAHGPESQPPHIQKAVQQYNLKYGVKSKCPPPDKQPMP